MTLSLISPLTIQEIPRNAALLDTNILVSRFDESDRYHAEATYLTDEVDDYVWVVAPPVAIEAFGVLGSRRGQQAVHNLLAWLLSPGTSELCHGSVKGTNPAETMREASFVMTRHRLDYVDSYLIDYAHDITEQSQLRPFLPIATFDTGDFLRCFTSGRKYSVFNVLDLELLEMTS